jgi:hypothetical protein
MEPYTREGKNMYTTIWSGRNVRAALTVKVLQESPAAIKFVVADNEKATFWLPKKALKMVDECYDLAFWFTKGEYLASLFNRYANHYKA